MDLLSIKVRVPNPSGEDMFGKVSTISTPGKWAYSKLCPQEEFDSLYGSDTYAGEKTFEYAGSAPVAPEDILTFLEAAVAFVQEQAQEVWNRTLEHAPVGPHGVREDNDFVFARRRLQDSAAVTFWGICSLYGLEAKVYSGGSAYTPNEYVEVKAENGNQRLSCKIDVTPFIYKYRGTSLASSRPLCRFCKNTEDGGYTEAQTNYVGAVEWYTPKPRRSASGGTASRKMSLT